jgi:hypothetical protein
MPRRREVAVTWVRLDDSFADHPKLAGLDDRSFRFFVWCLCYSARHLTDGFVSEATLARPFGDHRATKKRDRDRVRMVLVRSGLWHEVEGGIQIHDFLDFNPSRASVLEERQRAAERQARWRERQKRKRNAVDNAVTDKGRKAYPDPSPKGEGEGGGALVGAPPPPDEIFEANGQPCIVCERTGLPVLMHAGQWWCGPCLADYDRPGGQIELGQIEQLLAGEEPAT